MAAVRGVEWKFPATMPPPGKQWQLTGVYFSASHSGAEAPVKGAAPAQFSILPAAPGRLADSRWVLFYPDVLRLFRKPR